MAFSPFVLAPRSLKRWGMGIARLSMIAAAMACLAQKKQDYAPELSAWLAASQASFPQASRLGKSTDGWHPVEDAMGNILGWLTTTSPQGKRVMGYAGPSELLIVTDVEKRVREVRFWRSSDTAGHVEKVRRDPKFWEQWKGKDEASLGQASPPVLVSGASLTSEAMARALAARFGAAWAEEFFPQNLSHKDVQTWFPQATEIRSTLRAGVEEVYSENQKSGLLLRSSRMGINCRGFQGAADVLVVLDAEGSKVLGMSMLASRDNQPYVGDVQEEIRFAQNLQDRSIEEFLSSSDHRDFLVVSGASMTTRGYFTTVQEMLRSYRRPMVENRVRWREIAGMGWLVVAVVVGFRGGRRSRRIMWFVAVVAGLSLGWMVGQDQLIQWSYHEGSEVPAWPLLVMTAMALLVPALTGKNLYCSHICPHGAAQSWLGSLTQHRWALPAKWHRLMVRIPWLTLVAIWALAWWGVSWPWSKAEPFEVWSTGFVFVLPSLLFTVGLITAMVLPQSYCHYGCPTGALLKFLTHAPGRWTVRDSIAMGLISVAWLMSW